MKLTCLVSFLSLFSLITVAQNNRVEQKTVIEDGVVKTWKIEKSYDNEGNLINYDSTYSENPMNQSDDGSFHWNSGNGMQFGFNQGFGLGGADSLGNGFSQDWHTNFDEMMRKYKERLYAPIEVPFLDSLNPNQPFIFPEDRRTQKKI